MNDCRQQYYLSIQNCMNNTIEMHSTLELRDPNKTEQSIQPLPSLHHHKQCRICLNGVEERQNKLVSPCQCQGSMRYVHEICMRQWLQVKAIRQVQEDSMDNRQIKCQLCKTTIHVELQITRKCNQCGVLMKKIQQRLALFLVCILGLIFSVSLLAYSGIQLGILVKNDFSHASFIEKIVVVSSIALNILLIVLFIYNLSSYFLYRTAVIKLLSK